MPDKLTSLQQPHRLAGACQTAGIVLNRPGEYLVHVRSVSALHDRADPATCTPRFCHCEVEVVRVTMSPSMSLLKRALGRVNAYFFFWETGSAQQVRPSLPHMDDQSDLQNRIHGDVIGECRDVHKVDIMNAHLSVSWFGKYTLIFHDETYIVESVHATEASSSPMLAEVENEPDLIALG